MAMTGNHKAMLTADTVFLKNKNTFSNVIINTKYTTTPYSLEYDELLLTSDKMSDSKLLQIDNKIKTNIIDSLNPIQKLYYNPVILSNVLGVNLYGLYK